MKAFLDEQLSPQIAELLRDRGHDVETVAERSDLAGHSDRAILTAALVEDRAVVTNNVKDFRPLAAERLARGESHAGLILLPSTRTRTRDAFEALADAIEHVLREHPDGLPATERWIPPVCKP